MRGRSLSPDVGDGSEALLDGVEAAWERFASAGGASAVTSRLVVESWMRSARGGARPEVTPMPDLEGDALAGYRRGHAMAAALPAVRRLLVEHAVDAGLVVALTDEVGRLLWVEGAAATRRRAEHVGFAPGAVWAEERAGTNAPGTSLVLGAPVRIAGPEHYSSHLMNWNCAAAPIRAADGRTVGAVDVTGGKEAGSARTLALVRAVAATAETELKVQELLLARGRNRSILPSGEPGPEAAARLLLLGRPAGELVTPRGRIALRLRQAEILFLLSISPLGLTGEQLAVQLDERELAPVTVRAEMTKLRRVLDGAVQVQVQARPYRLLGPLATDVEDVRRLLRRGACRKALAAYEGPVLPVSQAPGVQAVREQLRRELSACLQAGRPRVTTRAERTG